MIPIAKMQITIFLSLSDSIFLQLINVTNHSRVVCKLMQINDKNNIMKAKLVNNIYGLVPNLVLMLTPCFLI